MTDRPTETDREAYREVTLPINFWVPLSKKPTEIGNKMMSHRVKQTNQ